MQATSAGETRGPCAHPASTATITHKPAVRTAALHVREGAHISTERKKSATARVEKEKKTQNQNEIRTTEPA